MQPLPPQLELPEGNRFACQPSQQFENWCLRGDDLPAHMVLMMICGKELWVPLDREIARRWRTLLLPSVNHFRVALKLPLRRANQTAIKSVAEDAPEADVGKSAELSGLIATSSAPLGSGKKIARNQPKPRHTTITGINYI